MAYPAAVSLERTINRLLCSSPFRIAFVPPSQGILASALEMVRSLRYCLEQSETKRITDHFERRISGESEMEKALGGKVREAAWELEDVLESIVSTQILSQSETYSLMFFSIDLGELDHVFDCFSARAKQMREDMEDLDNDPSQQPEDDDEVSVLTSFGGNLSEMVGFTDVYDRIRNAVAKHCSDFRILVVAGMAGSGKTTLAMRIFEDPRIKDNFDCCIFVSECRKSRPKRIMRAIIAQLNPDIDIDIDDKMVSEQEIEETLHEFLLRSLDDTDSKYLIVLDDLWNHRFLRNLQESLRKSSNGTTILVTTRIRPNAAFHRSEDTFDLRFMDEEESWDLFREKVFGEEGCPPHLEKTGKRIAENCEGLPLLIVTVANLLSNAEKTLEHWIKVAADKQNEVFEEAYEQILEVLYPSYNFLTEQLKACFLYMSVFPQNYEIRLSRLFKLLSAEEFVDIYKDGYPESFLAYSVTQLVDNNVALVVRRGHRDDIEVCTLHSVFWYLSRKEAGINKLHHSLNRYTDGLTENLETQRRVCIYKNVLFGIKDVYNSVATVLNARSLLCTGAYHQYQVPLCLSFLKLLRVLDALTIRFYEFPMQVLELVQLRYLALTYNGNLPPSISKLLNLQCLIFNKHVNIKLTLAESYLPLEIWGLQKLKYLKVKGRNLPNPPQGAVLSKLLKLFGVGAHSCTKDVLKSIPNLEKLRVHIELTPDAGEPLTKFDRFARSTSLRSLQLFVVNPKVTFQFVTPLPPLSVFSRNLTQLTLSGFRYPWKDMKEIAELSNLCVLNLQDYAFQGQVWELESGFAWLDELVIEDTDLAQWTIGNKTFKILDTLVLKNCYRLKNVPYISALKGIQLVDCNPSAVASAMQMAGNKCKVSVYSSWEER